MFFHKSIISSNGCEGIANILPNQTNGGELFDFVDEKRLFIGFLSPFAPNPRPKPRIFAQNAAKSLLGGSFGKAEHDQRRERLFELFAVAGSRKSGVGVAQSGELAAQLDDDFLGGFQPQPLDVFSSTALPEVMMPCNSRGE